MADEPVVGATVEPARQSWRPVLPRRAYLWSMVAAGVVTGVLGFYPFAWYAGRFGGNVVYSVGWAIILVQALLFAGWTANLRPWTVVLGFLAGFWGLVLGYVGATVLFFAFWTGSTV